MSKYQVLWERISQKDTDSFSLTFDEIAEVLGFPIDHSFLSCKKELIPYGYGYCVKKISMKEKTVFFEKATKETQP